MHVCGACVLRRWGETKEQVAGTVADDAESKKMRKCRACSTKELGSFVKAVESHGLIS